jgi:hypothetical protein
LDDNVFHSIISTIDSLFSLVVLKSCGIEPEGSIEWVRLEHGEDVCRYLPSRPRAVAVISVTSRKTKPFPPPFQELPTSMTGIGELAHPRRPFIPGRDVYSRSAVFYDIKSKAVKNH